MNDSELGPQDLQHFEDRVLFQLVDIAGATRPLGLGEYIGEDELTERLRNDPALGENVGHPRHILLEALTTLEDSGLADLMKVMGGPWGARPTRRGRDRVIEWQKGWHRNLDGAVQRAILAELDKYRIAHPETHETEGGLDVVQLIEGLGIDRDTYARNAEQLLNRGRIGLARRQGASLEDGDAVITEQGVAALHGNSRASRPAGELERAWNEVARLRKELETIQQSPADLITDTELLRRCADLLSAGQDFDRVIREASVVLEDRIRRLTGAQARSGVPLMQSVFSQNQPMLRVSTDSQEQLGAMNLYAGVMGLFRNQGGHRLSAEVTQQDALRFVVMVDLLIAVAEKAAAQGTAAITGNQARAPSA